MQKSLLNRGHQALLKSPSSEGLNPFSLLFILYHLQVIHHDCDR